MLQTALRSSNSRIGAAMLVIGFLVLELALGGRALTAVAQQAAQAQSFLVQDVAR